MTEPEAELSERVEKLEKRNGRLEWAIAGLIAVVAGSWIWLVTAGVARSVTGGEFAGGAIRTDDGAGGSARLTVQDAAGVSRIVLTVAEDGTPSLALADDRGALDVVLSGRQRGLSAMGVSYGNAGVRLMAGPGGIFPAIAMTDASNRQRLYIGLDPDGEPQMVLFDKDGSVRWQAP